LKQINILLISFVICVLITIPIFRALALRLNIVDIPNGNLKTHHKATPYLGGVGIFTALWLVLLFNVNFSEIPPGLFIGTLIILIVGLIDDMLVLSPFKKLLGQLLAALILGYYGFSVSLGLPFYGDNILAVVWLVGLMNAFNLIDVMDGVAVTACAGATCGLIGYVAYLNQLNLLILLIAFLGVQLAFFYHNRPCATIYLGDAGSMLLGATIGAIALKIDWINLTGSNHSVLNYLIAPVILGMPIIEVGSLIIIRRIKKIPFYAGSRDHYVHYLKRKNWSEYQILALTFAFSFLLSVISIVIIFNEFSFYRLVLLGSTTLALWVSVVFC
jgi:UDP-GlcNAc:undecaprenyl-phosphate/decaprenyl-phosphate GlcNAc-1-phosphate transferase